MIARAVHLGPLHGYLASRRARRLNLRPPGRWAVRRITDNPFHG